MKNKILMVILISWTIIIILLFIITTTLKAQTQKIVILDYGNSIEILEMFTLPHDSNHFYIYRQNDKLIEIILREPYWIVEPYESDREIIFEIIIEEDRNIWKENEISGTIEYKDPN